MSDRAAQRRDDGADSSGDIAVRGAATAEEVAALLAALAERGPDGPPPDGYRRWRATRLKSLRAHPRR